MEHIAIDGPTIILIGGVIGGLITTVGLTTVNVITALRTAAKVDSVAKDTAQITPIAKDTEAIKGHVNSEKTAADEKLVAARQENQLLRDLIADKKATAALLAQAAATAVAPIVPAVQSLQHIDEQTAAIANNTSQEGAEAAATKKPAG